MQPRSPRRHAKAALALLLGAIVLVFALTAQGSALDSVADEVARQDFSPVLRNFVLLSLLSLVPVMMIAMTSFTRIVIVLSLLRHALGLPQTPPNSVIIVLSLCLTWFTMAPVAGKIDHDALTPYLNQQITATEAIELGKDPLRQFMLSQTRESDLKVVLEMAKAPMPATAQEVAFSHLVPAFLLSELKTAFQIGFVIFLPFLLIDLVVSAILMALGMIMLPPTTISLPLKILLFILIDGWALTAKALLGSFWN
ncbi:flagellar type III secretion system pore protein FliP [Stenotrophomonas pavanii]|uniref:flagellar type III secretion system pore protein FliP n=1 Tax=Stenotrophomonas pavanii TaxID=487698 RepID=UPI0019D4B0DB|nr:flagellar type III secretion system pore protein FliP [Stenotrophomonas pavanii]MBN7836270.1 flagellar type III secretion system pore protein FliP [Stenotrophomonas maltophilia]MEC4339518.1 flagellar type III secretion system pore protein FliP [Stenotrophomonas pavanii]